MDLSAIEARLKTQLTGLKSVGVVADLIAASKGVAATPSAFVLPLAESAVDMGMLSTTGEKISHLFGVVLCTSNRRDAKGAAALDDLLPLRLNLRNALVGWVPDIATGEPVTFAGGHLLNLDGEGRLWWQDEFELTTYYWST